MVVLLLGCGSSSDPQDDAANAGGGSGNSGTGAASGSGNPGASGGSGGSGNSGVMGGVSGEIAVSGRGGNDVTLGGSGQGSPIAVGNSKHRIAAGSRITCAISDAAEVVCWGSDGKARVTHTALTGTYDDLAVGLDGSMQAVCATNSSGIVECVQWDGAPGGSASMVLSKDCLPEDAIKTFVLDRKNPGNFGYLDASGIPKSFPLNVACLEQSAPASIGASKRLALAANHACVITESDAIECWKLGLSDETEPTVSDTFVDVAVSSIAACGVTTAGKLRCWNYMGVEDTSSSSLPGEVNKLGPPVVAVASDNAGGRLCALLADGRAACAQDFNNNVISQHLLATSVQELAVGQNHVCGVRPDQSVVCVPFGCTACTEDIAPPPNLKVVAP